MVIEDDVLRRLIEGTARYLGEPCEADFPKEEIILAYDCAVFDLMSRNSADKLRKKIGKVA